MQGQWRIRRTHLSNLDRWSYHLYCVISNWIKIFYLVVIETSFSFTIIKYFTPSTKAIIINPHLYVCKFSVANMQIQHTLCNIKKNNYWNYRLRLKLLLEWKVWIYYANVSLTGFSLYFTQVSITNKHNQVSVFILSWYVLYYFLCKCTPTMHEYTQVHSY